MTLPQDHPGSRNCRWILGGIVTLGSRFSPSLGETLVLGKNTPRERKDRVLSVDHCDKGLSPTTSCRSNNAASGNDA